MAQRRGLREKILYAHNPLPNISDSELLEKAGLDLMEGATRPILFTWSWKYSAGLEFESLRLKPGEFAPLRENEAKDFMVEFREQGGVLAPNEDVNDPATRKLVIEGLTRAHTFYANRGANKRVPEWRKVHGLSKEEALESKYEVWTFYRNQAAADVIAERIQKLRAAPAAPTKKSAKE